jgi:hypothetical protein
MRRRSSLPLLFLALLLAVSLLTVACDEDKDSPLDESVALMETCRSAADTSCCLDSECAEGQRCDHRFICSPSPDGGIQCSAASGTRQCVDPCAEDGTCAAGTSCQELDFFQGGDHGTMEKLCIAD